MWPDLWRQSQNPGAQHRRRGWNLPPRGRNEPVTGKITLQPAPINRQTEGQTEGQSMTEAMLAAGFATQPPFNRAVHLVTGQNPCQRRALQGRHVGATLTP